MKITCPNCGRLHNSRYTIDSDWCDHCTHEELIDQTADIELGQIFGT